jgi:tetratricopeptide (TPR) repeat protein
MDEDFRAALAGSRSLIWQDGRAAALFALGHPLESSLEVYQNKWSQLPADMRAATELFDRSNLSLAVGDFRAAERQSLEARGLLAADPEAVLHAGLALQLVGVYTETNRLEQAGRIADDYLKRKAGWVSSVSFDDASLQMYWAMLRANLLTRKAFTERRDAWLREAEPFIRGWLRVMLLGWYASGVETEPEAREALQLFPDMEARIARGKGSFPALLGRLYTLTGRAREAVPHLEKAARSCLALAWPVQYVRGTFHLGQAEEATGDTAGACAAYGSVLARWGNATPSSRTARAARARWNALGCKDTPRTTRTL